MGKFSIVACVFVGAAQGATDTTEIIGHNVAQVICETMALSGVVLAGGAAVIGALDLVTARRARRDIRKIEKSVFKGKITSTLDW